MSGLVMAAQLILGLSIIVTLHELGHFLAARAFGIKVEKFFLFFDAWNFKLFSFKKGDTEYGVGWLPLGGYVKISGMIDESMDKEAMKLPPQPWEFRSKPAWQRLIVMLGGVIMNFILGIIIFTFVTLHYEKEYLPAESIDNGIYAYELGQQLGFETGDKILTVNGEKVDRFKDITSPLNLMGADIVVDRNGQEIHLVIPDTFYKNFSRSYDLFIEPDNFKFEIDSILPGSNAEKGGLKSGDQIIKAEEKIITSYGDFRSLAKSHKGQTMDIVVLRNADSVNLVVAVDSFGLIGFSASQPPYERAKYNVAKGLKYGIKDGIGVLTANIKGIGRIFSGEVKATESLQGPIGIANIYGGVWIWPKFWYLTGLISLILAFMNLLPIPALDGGHVMFLTWEAITRRQLSDKFMEKAQLVGMVILIGLMVFAVFNDLLNYIFK
ncbi:MAG: RIP metalloprotease RseP [Bacteroidales bacterium]|nr:RIP metalloprotease RseP [Bacteroidales bacterium]